MQQANFAAERERWHAAGLAEYVSDTHDTVKQDAEIDIPAGGLAVAAHMSGSIWKMACSMGDMVNAGDILAVIEAMKIEIPIVAPATMIVTGIYTNKGETVKTGQVLFTLAPIV